MSDHRFPRGKASVVGLFVGAGLGLLSTRFGFDFSLRLNLFLLALGAVGLVVVCHEAVHGLVAKLFGLRPRYGIEPPLVYVTFDEPVPRGPFLLIVLAPLLLLNAAFAHLWTWGIAPLFCWLCLLVNTLGAMGDLWVAAVILRRAPAGAYIQDTKTGLQILVPAEDDPERKEP